MAITVKHLKVSLIPDAGDDSLIEPSDWNNDHVLTGLGTMAEQNANSVAITGGTMSGVAITGYIPTTEKGAALGVATLDAGGKVPVSELPAAVLGALSYQGTWNASTNTPTLTSSVGTKGYYYVVSVAGSTDLDGITDWVVGDWAVFNGTVWQQIDNTDAVTSVNGQVGAVVLTQADISGTVPTSRTITAGTGLSGGGDLSANRTIALANTAVTAGTYGSDSRSITQIVDAQGRLTSVIDQPIAIANTQVSGLGTMSTQNANSVAITGGAIDGTTIGAITAADATVNELYVNQYATLAASTTASAPLKMPYGVAPTSPVAGDIWTSNTGLYFKNSSNTIEQLDLGSNTAGTLSNPVITVAGSGATIDVSSVNAVLFSLPAWQGDYQQYIVPAATGLALTDNSANYLVVSYNAGSPVYSIITNPALITNSDVVGATLLWRSGTEVHYQAINWGLSTASRVNRRLVQTDRYQRATGLALGESTGNVITLTAGNVWYGVSEIIEGAVTSASNNADFYYHVAGVWTKSTVSTYDITQYDTGTALATLSNGRYAVNWVYRYLDGSGLPKLAYILGSGNYTQAQALASSVPTPPPILSTMAILVGRIIVLKNAATAFEIDSAFTQVFSSTTVTSHNDLSGLQGGTTDEYYHLSNAQHTIATQAASASTNGYLTSTDWSTFNAKQPAGTYVTSVTGTAPVVSSGGTTPAISMAAATGSVNGYLTSTDWTTFNGKAPAVTYTTNYVPFGQGTTTPNLSSSFTYVTGTGTLTAPAVSASNGLVVNSNTVSASYTIPTGSSASSVGPMTVASGQTVTVPSGSRWVVL